MSKPPTPKIILCVPGLWPTRSDLVTTIAQHSDGWLFVGMILMEVATKRTCTLEVDGPDARLPAAFAAAGYGGRIDAKSLARIGDHRHVLYAVCDAGSLDAARHAVRAGAALLRAGGLAVKVESAGLAHSSEKWAALAADATAFDCYRALVTLVGDERLVSSCGMHAFGLPEVSCPGSVPFEEAGPMMNQFNLFQLIESPRLNDGETFSVDADAPRYRLRRRPCSAYPPDDPFHNPHGVWHLEPAEG